MTDDGADTVGILLPENRALSLRAVVFVVALTLISFVIQGFALFTSAYLDGAGPTGSGATLFICGVAILGAGINGYANDDLLVSIFMAAAPLVGFSLFVLLVMSLSALPELSESIRSALVLGGITFPLGSAIGFIGLWAGRRRS